MRRRPDAMRRLRSAIDKRARSKFKYGRFDCCAAAFDVWKAQSGVDIFKRQRGYDSYLTAAKVLKRWTPKGTPKAARLEVMVAKLMRDHGMVEVDVLRAQRGFIVLIEGETPDGVMDALGVVDLDGIHVLIPWQSGGWCKRPLSMARRAWGVA